MLAGALMSASTARPAEPAPAATAPTSAITAPSIPPAKIATSILAERPFFSGPILSPDGKRLLGRFNVRGQEMLGTVDIATSKVLTFSLGKLDLNWYRWAGNERVLLSVGSMVPWDGDEARQTRLLALDLTNGTPRFIGGKTEGLTGDDVLWVDPEGKSVLLAYQQTVYDYPAVYAIDLATNKGRRIVDQRSGLWDWYADDKGVVRAGFVFGDNSWKMIYRAKAEDPFRTVVKARNEDDDAGFDAFRIYQGSDEGYRIMLDEASGRYALYKFNYATRQRGEQVFATSAVDVDDFDTGFENNALYAAWFTDDRPRVKWFDAELENVQASIDKAVGAGRHAVIATLRRDRKAMLVWLGASNDPGSYFYFDVADGTMRRFARINEKLDPAALATTTYTRYKARDGLEIPAYLTLPSGRAPKGLPLVIMPHGGPYDVRDDGTWDAEVQFLANRGYAVLQPEFRGSGGYGKGFYEKGEGQWGRAMQDDLDDGMDWLAKQGTIDPKRTCLIGSSYGGYAALWGAVRNPERYRCAASFAGISDLPRQLKYQIAFKVSKRYRKDWRKTVQGDATFDLKTVSPLFAVDKLTVPVLLMHGDDDNRVPYKQSRLYAEALSEAKKPHEFYTLKGEGHGFSSSATMQQWLDKLDAFLGKYNPAEPTAH